MEKKAFDLIVARINNVLERQGFQPYGTTETAEDGSMTAVFASEAAAYSIFYSKPEERFDLRSAAMTDEGPEDNWKVISSWIFDPEAENLKEAESIADDFCNTVDEAKRRAAVRAAKRKAVKNDDDNNPGPVFFYKRLVNVFPELREEIAEEREAYEDFRAVAFAKEKVLPKIEAAAKQNSSSQMKKLCGFLDDFYKTGDADVRAIITMVIFNGISDTAKTNLLAGMSADFQKYYPRIVKYRNKTVRPERPKGKKSKIKQLQSTSNDTPERLSGKIPKEYR